MGTLDCSKNISIVQIDAIVQEADAIGFHFFVQICPSMRNLENEKRFHNFVHNQQIIFF
jgi:hypothetical protein